MLARGSLLAAAVLAAAVAGCGGGSSSSSSSSSSAPASSASSSSSSSTATTAGGCAKVPRPAPKPSGGVKPPHARLDPARSYVVTMKTSCGTIRIALDVSKQPKTASSFAYLVRTGFYDGLTFHRIVPGFVIQGGDPTGTGTGGPGYTVVETPPSSAHYGFGTVAMAKTQNEPSGASGSQFFIVSGADAGLPPQYAIAGHVVGGADVVRRIAAVPADPSTQQPQSPVVISRATLAAR